MKKITQILLLGFFAIYLSGCGVQSLPKAKNDVEAKLAEITNQYKRRADLIPNLVNTVKGFAAQEKETLTAVVEARAKATASTIDPSKVSAEQLQQFQQAQGQLSQALGRLMVVVERYPDLKSNQNFLDLQAQLEGTENRITIARQRYIESIRNFNDLVTVFPTNITNSLFFNFEKMPQWDVEPGENVKQAPEVKF
ncbi:MAG: LemA family protein [Bdellovibrionales bacterium]